MIHKLFKQYFIKLRSDCSELLPVSWTVLYTGLLFSEFCTDVIQHRCLHFISTLFRHRIRLKFTRNYIENDGVLPSILWLSVDTLHIHIYIYPTLTLMEIPERFCYERWRHFKQYKLPCSCSDTSSIWTFLKYCIPLLSFLTFLLSGRT